jgi:hypothetical protein
VQRWAKLNERQLAVLRRIGDGVEPVSAKDFQLANTVYALRDRGLAVTPRRDGIWRAEITDAGRYYLEHGRHPDTPDVGGSVDPVPIGTRQGRPSVGSPADLISRIQSEGGTLRVENPDQETRAAYRRAIHAAKQGNMVPAGLQLRHTGRTIGDLIIRLSGSDASDETDWNRIRQNTRDRVSRATNRSAKLKVDPAVLDVSEALLPRALHLVQALSTEAPGSAGSRAFAVRDGVSALAQPPGPRRGRGAAGDGAHRALARRLSGRAGLGEAAYVLFQAQLLA